MIFSTFYLLSLCILLILVSFFDGCVAQSVEQRPFKPLVEGSNPSTLTLPRLNGAFFIWYFSWVFTIFS